MQKALEDLGLTEAESKVYLALIKRGNSLAGAIAKETGLHRRTLYDLLYRLRAKGLVSNIVSNNKRKKRSFILQGKTSIKNSI